MPSMKDVAARAGVSISTVSHVLNNTRTVAPRTRGLVQQAAEEVGYRRPTADSPRGRPRAQTIGVALSALSNPYLAELVSAIEERLADNGMMMLLGETRENAEREHVLIQNLLDRRVAGVLLAPGRRSVARTLPVLRRSGLAVTVVDRMATAPVFDQVGSDGQEPMARLVDHLAQHGHRRIALVAGIADVPTTHERLTGYSLGLARNALPTDRDLVVAGGSSSAQAARAVRRLWQLPDRPTAVITANNAMTVGALTFFAAERISVPGDIAVAGYDDFEWSGLMSAPLTAVAQDWPAIGRSAVELLMRRLANPSEPPRSLRIGTTLITRRSCGCRGKTRRTAIPLTDDGSCRE